jgi:outer membrane protein OmpA-like peptidoglycan-associated protein
MPSTGVPDIQSVEDEMARNIASGAIGRVRLSLAVVLALGACSFSSGAPYLVYFQERSAGLDAQAQDVVALAARRANAAPAAPVEVVGYTDSAGSPPADVLLSQRRAQAVADALVANGVAANRLVRMGRGQTGENPGVASRRVEITIGG